MPKGTGISDEEKAIVLGHLSQGRGNSITAREIANRSGMLSDRTDILVRSAIADLIEDGQPIGSWAGGYYIIETEEELQDVLSGIRVRIQGMQERMQKVEENFRREHP